MTHLVLLIVSQQNYSLVLAWLEKKIEKKKKKSI